jgi:hypothetical protein
LTHRDDGVPSDCVVNFDAAIELRELAEVPMAAFPFP